MVSGSWEGPGAGQGRTRGGACAPGQPLGTPVLGVVDVGRSGMSSGAAPRLRALQRHLGSSEVGRRPGPRAPGSLWPRGHIAYVTHEPGDRAPTGWRRPCGGAVAGLVCGDGGQASTVDEPAFGVLAPQPPVADPAVPARAHAPPLQSPGQRGLFSGAADSKATLCGFMPVWTQGWVPHTHFCPPLVAQGRGMEPVSSPLTTHVLDTASGLPAQGVCLRLSRLEDHGQQWMELRKR